MGSVLDNSSMGSNKVLMYGKANWIIGACDRITVQYMGSILNHLDPGIKYDSRI